jgi:HSP20 family molecular chaperone IbpA
MLRGGLLKNYLSELTDSRICPKYYYSYHFSESGEDNDNKVSKNPKELIVDLPGYEKEDVEIELNADTLSIKTSDGKISQTYNVKNLEVDNASMKAGQLKIVFKEKAGTKIKID